MGKKPVVILEKWTARQKERYRLSSFCVYTLLFGLAFALGCTPVPQGQLMRTQSALISPAYEEINNNLAALAILTPVSSGDYRIGPEDVLLITLFNVPESEQGLTPRTMTVRVSQQGVITLPLLGNIQAAGLTTSAVEQALQERYKKYLRNPQVGVKVGEYHSQRVSVIGAVKTPGVLELSGPKTLIDVLALVGGVSDKAGMQVHLYRQGMEGREKYVVDLHALAVTDGTANMLVSGGDVVNVPQAGTFFVDGAVKSPGSYLLDRPYSLSQALIKAGGVDIELAQTSTITLLQRRGPDPLTVNLDEVMAGKVVDPQVEPEDVIVVPVNPAKYFVKRFIGVLFTGSNLSRLGY